MDGMFNHFDDYFFNVFLGSTIYQLLIDRMPVYIFLIFLYALWLTRRYIRWRRKKQAKERRHHVRKNTNAISSRIVHRPLSGRRTRTEK